MKTRVYEISPSHPDIGIIKEAAKVVENGGIVAFPTETVYGLACKADAESLDKLDQAKNRPGDKRYTLIIDDVSKLDQYVPGCSYRAKKLAKHYWPGPLTIVFELDSKQTKVLKKRYDSSVFKSLYVDGTIGIRCPQGEIPRLLLKNADCPVVAPSANISGQAPACDAQDVLSQLDGRIDMVLDGGKCHLEIPSTVVKIGNEKVEILRQGAVSEAEILKNSTINIVFVCTGNTCRSPIAEGLCKKYLAEKKGCRLDQLEDLGYKIASAGVMAVDGMPVSIESVSACEQFGIDLSSYVSTAFTGKLLEDSDFIFAMCASHVDNILSRFDGSAGKIFKLRSKDIEDPIGAGLEIYEKCARDIYKSVQKRIVEFGL